MVAKFCDCTKNQWLYSLKRGFYGIWIITQWKQTVKSMVPVLFKMLHLIQVSGNFSKAPACLLLSLCRLVYHTRSPLHLQSPLKCHHDTLDLVSYEATKGLGGVTWKLRKVSSMWVNFDRNQEKGWNQKELGDTFPVCLHSLDSFSVLCLCKPPTVPPAEWAHRQPDLLCLIVFVAALLCIFPCLMVSLLFTLQHFNPCFCFLEHPG